MIKSQQLDSAYEWLCRQRRNYPDNADIWHLRFHWGSERERILAELRHRNYRVSPLQRIGRQTAR